jgi:DNA primase catalytic core
MSVTQACLDRIRELVSLADYFRDHDVHKEGPRHVCNCPFHTNSGKSRTLTLFPDGKAKCWSCGWKGDLFDACMSKEGCDWMEAVERLAKRAGIAVERTGTAATNDKAAAERARRSAAWAAAEWATTWMQAQLVAAPEALGYLLVERKLPREVVERWRLGYAPGDQLIPAAKAAGIAIEALRDAGLVVEKEEGRLRSFFYERICIPITNQNGRVIAWTARAMPATLKDAAAAGRHVPKYINPSDSLIYLKRKALLGLRDAVPRSKEHQAIVLVEGALDVLALDALGVPVGCCACGVALGDDQAGTLIDLGAHHEVPIVLLYDGDGAGNDANRKTAELLFRLGGRAKVALLPSEVDDPHGGKLKVKDCADLWSAIGTAGGALVTAAILAAVPAWDYLVQRACPAAGAADIDARLIAADKLLAVVNQIEDDERRDLALAAAGEALGLTRAQLVRRSDRQRDDLARTRGAAGQHDPQSAGNPPEGVWAYKIPAPDPESAIPPSASTDFELNELGNALRFAAQFGTRVRYVATWGVWILWNGTHWTIDNAQQAQRWMFEAIDIGCRAETSRAWDKARTAPKNSRDASDWTQRAIELERWRAKNLGSRSKGNSLDVATCLRCLVCTSEMLDADPYLFACKNGWVDLRTGILSPHDPLKLYTRSCIIDYDPAARDARWEKYLDESTAGHKDIAEFLQRFSGYSATGDISEQALLMISGPGGTGKSLFTRCIKAILGGYAYTADFSVFLASHGDKVKWTLANLEKARLVICEESGEGRRFSADIVKQVTGGTPIEAQSKGKQPFTYDPLFKVVLVTNHPPRVSDRDDGFWRRMKLVRFDTIPAKRDKNLALHLTNTKAAQQAILAWIVAGAMAWHQGGLQTPAAIEGANATYRDEQNPVRDYLCERTTWADVIVSLDLKADPMVVAKSTLRLDYMGWCKDQGIEPISARQFAERLRELGAIDDGYAYNPERERHDRAWSGLRLRLPELDEGGPLHPHIPGGPLAYQPAAEAAAEQSQPQQVLDTGTSESGIAAPTAANIDGPDTSNMCGCSPVAGESAATQPDAADALPAPLTSLTSSPVHPRAPARDACAAPENASEKGDPSSIRARSDPICDSAAEEGKGSPQGNPDPPPPGSRADKLRRQPHPGEDLFANPPPDQPPTAPREPGADEDEVWPPPEGEPT